MLRLSLAFLLLCGCASTKIESTWTSPDLASRQIKRFAVLGVSGSPSGRISFEETLTKGLTDKGLNALPGYDFVTYDEHPSKEEVIRRLQAKDVDGVLVTRVAGRKTQIQSTPVWVGAPVASPFYGGFYDYWYAPGAVATYTTEESEFVVETVLYALSDNKPLWAARSVTSRDSPSKFARDIASTVADQLKKDGLVAQ
jgi:hypothetical protein